MTPSLLLPETQWLRGVLDTLKEEAAPDSFASLQRLRDRLIPLAWAEGAPRAHTFAAENEGERFRRHPLASIEALSCSALLMYWPPGHATLPHDHDGLWGIEVVIDGALSVNEFVRVGDLQHPTLAPTQTLNLGVGDAAMFDSGRYVHRCRNLSNVSPTLTLHVYGGALTAYNSFRPGSDGRYSWNRETARNDRQLS